MTGKPSGTKHTSQKLKELELDWYLWSPLPQRHSGVQNVASGHGRGINGNFLVFLSTTATPESISAKMPPQQGHTLFTIKSLAKKKKK